MLINRLTRLCSLLLIALLTISISTDIYGKVEPHVKYMEISSGQFTVVFPASCYKEASRLLTIAPGIYRQLTEYWGNRVKGRIRILLTDNRDYSNGSATFFPFNTIEVQMKPPAAETSLGKYSNWLDMVLCHELTHLINFHAGNGFMRVARKITGTNPFFYPVAILPGWFLEGTAVYSESALFEGGRLNTSNYREILKIQSKTDNIPHWSRLDGLFSRWPGGSAQYIFGAGFIRHLARTQGKDTPAELISSYVNSPLILPVEFTLRKVTGQSVTENWNSFSDNYKDSLNESPAIRITESGYTKGAPAALKSGEQLFYFKNHKEYSGIYLTSGREGRYLNRQSGINSKLSVQNNRIWYSALSVYSDYATYSDIYYYDMEKKKSVRVTKGERLFSPVAVKSGTLCVKRDNHNFYIALLSDRGEISKISEPYENIQDLQISQYSSDPLLSLRTREHTKWQIAIFNIKTREMQLISPKHMNCHSPLQISAESILFPGEVKGQVKLFRYNKESNTTQVSSNITSLYQIGNVTEKELIYTGYTEKGIDLFSVDLNNIKWQEFSAQETISSLSENPETKSFKAESYKTLRDLVPHYFAPSFRNGGDELQPGIMISGNDLLKRHMYTGEFYYGFQSEKPGYRLSYTYDGMKPSIAVWMSNLYSRHKNINSKISLQQETKINTGLFFNILSHNKSSLKLYTGYYRERARATGARNFVTDFGGFKTALLFNSAKNYRDSVSPSDGFRFTLSYTRDQRGLGSDYNINTISLDYRHYISILKPVTATIRFGFAESGGEAGKLFDLGGKGEVEVPAISSSDIFTLMRGYPSGYTYGTGGWITNIELRFPLFNIERGYWFINSFDRVWFTLFFDAGNLWLNKVKIDPLKSVGGELNLRLKAGILQMTLSAGVAFPIDAGSAKIYFRMGSSL